MKRTATMLSILMLCLTENLPSYASDLNMPNMDMTSSENTHQTATEAVGMINEIDLTKGVVNISHEAIKSLGWSAMTMNFTVKDRNLLHKLGKGKSIHFAFVQQQGHYLITEVK